jgi:hypothetical protein
MRRDRELVLSAPISYREKGQTDPVTLPDVSASVVGARRLIGNAGVSRADRTPEAIRSGTP